MQNAKEVCALVERLLIRKAPQRRKRIEGLLSTQSARRPVAQAKEVGGLNLLALRAGRQGEPS